jgi:hypothetical protein
MSRFLGALLFVGSVMTAEAAFAAPERSSNPTTSNYVRPPRRAVPELSATGSAAGLALIGGAAAIAFGRRRARRA